MAEIIINEVTKPFVQNEYNKLSFEGNMLLNSNINFNGEIYRVCNFWYDIIPIIDGPINYLEVGVYHGANAVSISYTYCKNLDSEIHCIDPWSSYNGIIEEHHKDEKHYDIFMSNINQVNDNYRFYIHRGISSLEIPKLENNYFDIIYLDGNHEPEYSYEDGVLSMEKLKKGGYLIFDDYTSDHFKSGINKFCNDYIDKIKILKFSYCQLFIQKL